MYTYLQIEVLIMSERGKFRQYLTDHSVNGLLEFGKPSSKEKRSIITSIIYIKQSGEELCLINQ